MRTLRKQLPELEQALARGETFVVRAPLYRWLGLGAILVGLGCYTSLLRWMPQPTSGLSAWGTAALMSFPPLTLGLFAFPWGTMTVSAEGVRVVNPINEAWMPWCRLEKVEVFFAWLRFRTEGFKVGVLAVEQSNWERPGASRADRFAQILSAELVRRQAEGSQGGGACPPAEKQWRWRPSVWAIVGALALAGYLYARARYGA